MGELKEIPTFFCFINVGIGRKVDFRNVLPLLSRYCRKNKLNIRNYRKKGIKDKPGLSLWNNW